MPRIFITMRALLVQLRYAGRSLSRDWTFAFAAAATLALGVAAVVAALNLADKVLREPLGGIPDQDRLAVIRTSPPPTGSNFAIPDYLATERDGTFGARFDAIGQVAGYFGRDASIGLPGRRGRVIQSLFVSADYFRILGVTPALGSFTPPAELAPGEQGIVLSNNLWAAMFDRRPDAVGSAITYEGSSRTVIGIAPPGFHGTERLNSTDAWIPNVTGRRGYSVLLARLRPGVTIASAGERVRALIGQKAEIFAGLGVDTQRRGEVAQFFTLVVAGSTLLLLIACANVANLLLFRGLARENETALHRALGASSANILSSHLSQAAALALPAMLLAVPLSIYLTNLLGKVRLTRFAEPFGPMPMGWSRLATAGGVAILVALAAGLFPAVLASRAEPSAGVRDHGPGRAGRTLRHAFATTQVALSLSLVVTMFLMVSTMTRLRAIDLGFDPHGVLVLNTNPGNADYPIASARQYFRNLYERFRAAPEFTGVAVADYTPLAGSQTVLGLSLDGRPRDPREELRVRVNRVSGEYFDVMRLSLLEGRPFAASELFPDSGVVRPIILGRSVAQELLGNRPALGQDVYMWGERYRVIGVSVDSHWDHVEPKGGWVEDPRLLVYVPFEGPRTFAPYNERTCASWMCAGVVLARARGDEATARAAIRRIAAEADPLLPAYDITTLQEMVDLSMVDRIVLSRMMTVLSALATLLAAIGVYGMIAYTVASRRRELAIRIALGARIRRVALLLLKELSLVTGVGVAVGIAGALVLSRLVASHLYGVSATDGVTYALGAGAIVMLAMLAAAPAIRVAARIEPMESLKAE